MSCGQIARLGVRYRRPGGMQVGQAPAPAGAILAFYFIYDKVIVFAVSGPSAADGCRCAFARPCSRPRFSGGGTLTPTLHLHFGAFGE